MAKIGNRARLLWAVLGFVAMLHAKDETEVARTKLARVEVDMEEARIQEAGEGKKLLRVVGSIENRTASDVTMAVVSIAAFGPQSENGGKREQICLNPLFTGDSAGALPYTRDSAALEVVVFSGRLAPGEKALRMLSVPLLHSPNRKEDKIEAVRLEIVGAGDWEWAKCLLGSPLLSPLQRETVARAISPPLGFRFKCVDDVGNWREPGLTGLADRIAFAALPEAPQQEQVSKDGPRFESTYSRSNQTVIEVINAANQTITVTLLGGGIRHVVDLPAQSTRSIEIVPSLSSFTATAIGVKSLSGTKQWEAGRRYTWKFWISSAESVSPKP